MNGESHPGGGATSVSVVIPAHNAAAFLGDCLDSVGAQSGDFAVEVIVVDDGSTDGTARLASAWPGVRLVQQPRRGPAAARNAGIEDACGDFVAFLDADDLWPEGSLAVRVQALRTLPQAAMVFGDCRQFEDGGEARPSTVFEGSNFRHSRSGGAVVPDAWSELLRDNVATTGTVLVRREALREAGGFREALQLVEDLDLWLHIARRHPVAACTEVCLLRRRHAHNTSRDPVAMSLAFLEVLGRQRAEAGTDAQRSLLAALSASEQMALSDHAMRRGEVREARQRAWQALRGAPGLRPLRQLARAWLGRSPGVAAVADPAR